MLIKWLIYYGILKQYIYKVLTNKILYIRKEATKKIPSDLGSMEIL